jgi:Mrp family chromosome partitioning ATPase
MQQGKKRALTEGITKIKHNLVVLSGKGGVGKSTVAVNLAYVLARRKFDVGLLDVDIHGPNTAKMLGLEGERIVGEGKNGFRPVLKLANLKVASMAFLLENPDTPVIWRGPLKMKIIEQFLRDVNWGQLDYLIVDSPPGTGDEPLSVCQLIDNIDGAVIVTTPQEVAILDVKKCINFTRQLNVPILGLIENMAGFVCPHCKSRIEIFPVGGAEKASQELGIPFLGRIPLEPGLTKSGDRGESYPEKYPESETAKKFNEIVDAILTQTRERKNHTTGK